MEFTIVLELKNHQKQTLYSTIGKQFIVNVYGPSDPSLMITICPTKYHKDIRRTNYMSHQISQRHKKDQLKECLLSHKAGVIRIKQG